MEVKSIFAKFLTLSLLGSFLLGMPVKVVGGEGTVSQRMAQADRQLTEEKIRQMMAAVEEAEKKEDIESLLRYLVPFTVSEVTVESQGKSITTTLEGIPAHRKLLEKTFELVKDRKPINQYLTVRITPDGQLGIVNRIVLEEITTSKGRRFITSGTDIFHVAWLDGGPKIVFLKSQGWMAERPQE